MPDETNFHPLSRLASDQFEGLSHHVTHKNHRRMIAYVGLFASALVAATILPMQSEAVLVGLLINGEHLVVMLLLIATVGNVLGSVINWYIGRFLMRFKDSRWFPASDLQIARAEEWYRRYGRWSLLGSWLPIVGDPLTVVAGILREPIGSFLLIVSFAKGVRYLLLAALTLTWFGNT
jgi:membrane protein YqaA with SNARE-associated domain